MPGPNSGVCRFLTGALEEVSKTSGLNQRFLGLIVLPIAGNACEHITACFVAVKNKMDLSIGVALGSSIQVRCACCPAAAWPVAAHGCLQQALVPGVRCAAVRRCTLLKDVLSSNDAGLQIAIFVLPVCVLAGWAMDRPFTFNFDPFASLILTLSVIHAYFVRPPLRAACCQLHVYQLVQHTCLVPSFFLAQSA